MRLLNVHTLELRDFNDPVPLYAIASHRWSEDEPTYQDWIKDTNTSSIGYKKVARFKKFIRETALITSSAQAIDWLWIDTVCIDKSSYTELTEAMNSMFRWYQGAQFCMAYLADVGSIHTLKKSNWFTRGWTLQELLAPRLVLFISKDWSVIAHTGTSDHLSLGSNHIGKSAEHEISEITGIPPAVLKDYSRGETLRIEEKLSWAQRRQTTRIEDQAYCLLGLLNVNMALIYGEREEALPRLMRKVQKRHGVRPVVNFSSDPSTLSGTASLDQRAW